VTMAFAGTGELPFKGESLTAVAYGILHSEPTVGRLPEPLGSLVHRCLNKDLAGRPSARDALGEFVAAGVRLVGPMPPVAPAPATDDQTPSSQPAYAVTTGPPRGHGEGLLSTGPTTRPRSARHGGSRTQRRRRRAATLLAAIVVVGGVGALVFNLPRHGAPPEGLTGQSQTSQEIAAQEARSQAVAWIVHQASRADIVSCDPVVCQDLVKQGFPESDVLPLGSGSNDPLGSALVVATAAVEAQFGGRLESVYAPIVLASFGQGSAKINIRWLYPGGTDKYHSVAPGDLSSRQTAEAQLLTNSQITVSPKARAQLLSGDIDPRLPQLLATMAGIHPVDIVAFVGESPGGGPASLMRAVDLATADTKAHMTPTAYLGWIKGFIEAQRSQYLPVWEEQAATPGTGQAVLQIAYGAPSPLS
jgi:hypothetical protein